jgi:hypothetical protein
MTSSVGTPSLLGRVVALVGFGVLAALPLGGVAWSSNEDGGVDAISTEASALEPTRREVEAGVRDVVVIAPTADQFFTPPVVDDINGRVVLSVHAFGFEPLVGGHVEQCVLTRGRVTRCGNSFPVQFTENGTARFQYLVGDRYRDPAATAPICAPGTTSCVVLVTDGDVTAVVQTVFGAPMPEQRVTFAPAPNDLVSGERVHVAMTGFTPGTRVRVALCAAPAIIGTSRCGAPGPVTHALVAADGTATARLAMREGSVGTDHVACGRDTPCALVVNADAGVPVVPAVDVTFLSGPGAAYDATQVALGLTVAAMFLALAVLLARTTDWRKPSEADTPEMDAAVLVDDL